MIQSGLWVPPVHTAALGIEPPIRESLEDTSCLQAAWVVGAKECRFSGAPSASPSARGWPLGSAMESETK